MAGGRIVLAAKAKTYRVRKSKKSKKMAKKVSAPIRNYVKRVVHGNIENKTIVGYAVNQSITSALTPANPFAIQNLLPAIGQGVGHSSRTGNEIKIRRAYVSGYVNLLPYSLTNNPLSTPIMVKMWLCSYRLLNTNLITSTSISTDFFEINNGSIGFQGNMLDMILTPNKDSWIIHATKKFELGATYASTNGQVGTGGYFDNSKMTIPFYFNYGKYFKSALKYNDAASNVPTNKNLFLVIQAVNADGSSSAIVPAECHYQFRVDYEDA